MGYDPDFIGIRVDLPTFSQRISGDIVRDDRLDQGYLAHYPHYSLAVNKRFRSPAFVALNIDQNLIKSVDSDSDRWVIDTVIGSRHQLNNDYYNRNAWDRGHMARRASAAWGTTKTDAKLASDQTYYFTNSCLQHMNFNRDEWVDLEDWVKTLALDKNGKINSVSGPYYGANPRSVTPPGRRTALIPTGFFKVVTFMNLNGQLETRAFLMAQDDDAVSGYVPKIKNFQCFQATVAEIELLTGLIFPDNVAERNPLFFHENRAACERLNVVRTPERIEIDDSQELVGHHTVRATVRDNDIDAFIMAAMVNPVGRDRGGEWISIVNLSDDTMDIEGWTLRNRDDRIVLTGTLGPGEARRIQPITPLRLINTGSVLSLFAADGSRVDRVHYTKTQARREGKPIVFGIRDSDDALEA